MLFSRGKAARAELPVKRGLFFRLYVAVVLSAFLIMLSAFSLSAQEIIDPRAGQLYLTVTDLSVQAGPMFLTVDRTFKKRKEEPGLVGTGWCLNWEGSLFRQGAKAVVQDGSRFISFERAMGSLYKSFSGDQVVFDEYGKGLRKAPSGNTYTYDAEGWLVEKKEANGSKVSLQYSKYGMLERIEGPGGAYLLFSYHDNGLVAAIESSTAAAVKYRYDQESLVEVTVNGAVTARYSYGKEGQLVGIERSLTGEVLLTYDAKDRVTKRRWADGSQEQYAFGDVSNTCRYINASGAVTTIKRSSDGRREEIIDPEANETVIKYNGDGRPVIITGPTGRVTRISYDALGRTVAVEGCCDRKTVFEYKGETQLLKTVVYPDGSSQEFTYDGAHNLLSIKKGRNVLIEITYSPEGYVLEIKGLVTPERTFTYHADGNMQSETNALGETTRFQYDPQGRLAKEIDPAGAVTQWGYDQQGRIVRFADPAGAVTRYAYDKRGRLIKETDSMGGVTQYEYDGVGRLTAEADPLGRKTIYAYDADGRLKKLTDPAGNTQRFAYNKGGGLVKAVDPMGAVSEYAYGPMGQLVHETDPLGRKWSYETSRDGLSRTVIGPDKRALRTDVDPKTRQERVTDEKGLAVTYQYDENGLLASLILPGGGSLSYAYDDEGNLISTSDSSGPNVKYSYDLLGRVIKEKHGTGLEIHYQYDAVGNLVSVHERLGGLSKLAAMVGKKSGSETILKYNSQGLLSEYITAGGAVTGYRHDLAGRLLEETDPMGGALQMAYNAAGELVEVKGPSGDKAQYEYDKAGFLKSIHHPAGGVTKITRDAVGNILGVTNPLGKKTAYTFDKASRLVRAVDSKGQKTTYSYDKLGRLAKKALPGGKQIVYKYDEQGNLTEVNDGAFPVLFAYDDLGRPIERRYPAIRRVLKYAYDDQDRLISFTDSEGRRLEYGYDKHGRLSKIFLPEIEKGDEKDKGASGKRKFGKLLGKKGQSLKFTYDAKNRMTSVTYPNGIKGKWKYDVMDRPVEITYGKGIGKTLLGWKFSYDKAGNPVTVVDTSGKESWYAYNKAGQLIEEMDGSSRKSYYYRSGGNREVLEGPEGTEKYEYNDADQLLRAGKKRFTYDANGNLFERKSPEGLTQYAYNSENRLEKVTLPDGSQIRFGYAPTGERIWREDKNGRTWFVTDGENVLAELDGDLNVTDSYLHGPGLDRPLMMWQQGASYHYHAGLLGTVSGLTDEEGALIAAYQTDAFGNLKAKKGSVTNPFIYTARYFEADLDLYYYRARYYDPALGRFLSKDPLWPSLDDPEGMSRYAYVRNTPTRYRDPMGLTALERAIGAWHNGQMNPSNLDSAYGLPSRPPGVRPYQINLPGRPRILDFPSNDETVPGLRPPEPTITSEKVGRGRIRRPLRGPRQNDITQKVPVRKGPVRRSLGGPRQNDITQKVPVRSTVRRTLRGSGHDDITQRVPVRSTSGRTLRGSRQNDITQKVPVRSTPRKPGVPQGGRSTAQPQSLSDRLSPDLNRPLTPDEKFGMGALGGLVLIERWQDCTMVRKKSKSDCAVEMAEAFPKAAVVGAVAGLVLVPIFGPTAVAAGALAITIATYASSVPQLVEEGRKWEQAQEDFIFAHKQRNQLLKDNVSRASTSLGGAQSNIDADMGPVRDAARAVCEEASGIASRTQQLGNEAKALVSQIQAEGLGVFEAAHADCQRIPEIRAEIAQMRDTADQEADRVERTIAVAEVAAARCQASGQDILHGYEIAKGLSAGIIKDAALIKAKKTEVDKIAAQAGKVRQSLVSAVEKKYKVIDNADRAFGARNAFQAARARHAKLKARLKEKQASWNGKINGLAGSFPSGKIQKSKDSDFIARYDEMVEKAVLARAKTGAYAKVDCPFGEAALRLEAGIEMAVHARLEAENIVRTDITSYDTVLSECAETSLDDLISGIYDAFTRASQAVAQHEDLPQKAALCDQRAEEEDAEGGFGRWGASDGDQDSSGSEGFELLGEDTGDGSDSEEFAVLGQEGGEGRPLEGGPRADPGQFAAPGSAEALRAMEDSAREKPMGDRRAAELREFMDGIDRQLTAQKQEADEFFREGMSQNLAIMNDIIRSDIERKKKNAPQEPKFPYDLSRPPGPAWTPDAGWGGKGDKLKRCRENYAALQAVKNDTTRFQSLLGGAKGCDHEREAQWHLAKLERRDRCPALRAKLQAAAQANDVITYRDLVNKAQIYECKEVYQWSRAQQGSVEQRAREQKERERIARIKPPSGISPGGGTTEGDAGSAMSYGDCLRKHCPECSQELGLMHEGVTWRCEGCKRRKQKILSQCSGLGYDPGRYKTEWYVIEHLRYNEEKYRWEPTGNYSVENRKEKSKIEGKQDYKVIYGPAYWDQCDKKREDLER